MPISKLIANLLQEKCAAKKTHGLFAAVAHASENLIRFCSKEGNIYSMSSGPIKDRNHLDILDCHNP